MFPLLYSEGSKYYIVLGGLPSLVGGGARQITVLGTILPTGVLPTCGQNDSFFCSVKNSFRGVLNLASCGQNRVGKHCQNGQTLAPKPRK